MKHETTLGLYRYWNTVRSGRRAPRRYEIEPAQIVPFLAETLILEQQDDNDCRVRVAGTHVNETLGVNLRGQTFYDLWSEPDQVVLRDNIRTITEHGSVGFFTFSAALGKDEPIAEFEMLLLPLTHLEDRIDRLLGCISVVGSPEWLDSAPPVSLDLLSNELIWPDGRPRPHASLKEMPLFARREFAKSEFAKSEFARREVPSLRPNEGIRHARLVRSDRRSFLVYDGGLAKSNSGDDTLR
jgi:hypothetical protein